jgi:predicted ester cyclase
LRLSITTSHCDSSSQRSRKICSSSGSSSPIPNSESGEIRGADTIKGEIEYFRSAVPDLTYTVEDQVAEGDKVVTRYTARGTHQGEFFGIPGSGNRIEMTGIQIDRFDESGKMIEEWPEYDLLGAMRQIGAVPES